MVTDKPINDAAYGGSSNDADGNIIPFQGTTVAEWTPEIILEKAKSWPMRRCLVIGVDEKGELQFGASFSDGAEANLMLDRAKAFLLSNLEATVSHDV